MLLIIQKDLNYTPIFKGETMYQKRYLAYAKANGLTPENMLEFDRSKYPGGCMTGYICWVQEKIKAFKDLSPESFHSGFLADNNRFDVFLKETA